LTNEAVCETPLNVTEEEAMKPLPLIVSVSAPDPATAEAGARLVMEGFGLPEGAGVMVKRAVFELPPPGGGLLTTTAELPAVARSDAASVIVS